MTAVLEQAIPDPVTVLKRIDAKLAANAGDDPLPAETIVALADGVRRQIIEPLTATPDGRPIAELERALANAQSDTISARAERDQLRTRVDDLRIELATARKTLEQQPAATAHQHYYPWRSPDEQPGPCDCGQPYPRARRRPPPTVRTEREPFAELMGRLRVELADWNGTGS